MDGNRSIDYEEALESLAIVAVSVAEVITEQDDPCLERLIGIYTATGILRQLALHKTMLGATDLDTLTEQGYGALETMRQAILLRIN